MSTSFSSLSAKIQNLDQSIQTVRTWQQQGWEVVFTNGCFDLIHYGHLHYLAQAGELGDKLVIGLNSEASVSRLKGPHRPIKDEATRSHLLAALAFVDLVVIFDEDTPLELIQSLRPDVLVKGGDYTTEQIVGAPEMQSWGGSVEVLAFVDGYSTTAYESKIKATKE
jgi:D-glycero-beta-D-manno-heptose 1-phosphate adenylyltransferase